MSTNALLFSSLILLLVMSAFFSGSETGMMSINRYRLRHLAKKGDKRAKRVYDLLHRPDRLLGVILIGNTFANVFASFIAAILADRLFGKLGVAIASFVIALVLLVGAEVTPKTLAALYPERVAYPASWLLKGLLRSMYFLVFIVNAVANAILNLFGVKVGVNKVEALSHDELRTLLREAMTKTSFEYQDMMLGVLDLGRVTVEDIMVPRNDIIGIDLENDWEEILNQLQHSAHTRVPLYQGSIENIKGMLHAKRALHLFAKGRADKTHLLSISDEVYFIPEATPLSTLLFNLRQEKQRVGLVVDEYGDIQGLATMEDILEEIVGEFTTDLAKASPDIYSQKDGSFIVDGGASVRELNRTMMWELPMEGPKTISGLIIEQLENIPETSVCLRISGYPLAVLSLEGNTVKQVQIWPDLRRIVQSNDEEDDS